MRKYRFIGLNDEFNVRLKSGDVLREHGCGMNYYVFPDKDQTIPSEFVERHPEFFQRLDNGKRRFKDTETRKQAQAFYPSSVFVAELENLISCHNRELCSDTPDFILANYIEECLKAFESATNFRDSWYIENKKRAPLCSEYDDDEKI